MRVEKKKLAPKVALIIFEGLLTVAVFLMFGNMGLGWFSVNRQVNVPGMAAVIDAPPTLNVEEYRVYKHSPENDQLEEVSNNVAGDPLFEAQFEMNEYDTILTERNTDTHVVLKVIFSRVKADADGLRMRLTHSTPLANDTDPLELNLSNITAVRWMYGDHTASATAVYNAFTAQNTPQKFVTVTRSGNSFHNTKVDAVTLDLGDYTSYVYTEDGVDKLCVLVELSYDDALVDEYIEQNNVVSASVNDLLDLTVDFVADFDPILFDYIENGA